MSTTAETTEFFYGPKYQARIAKLHYGPTGFECTHCGRKLTGANTRYAVAPHAEADDPAALLGSECAKAATAAGFTVLTENPDFDY
jgi:hypothetical protein